MKRPGILLCCLLLLICTAAGAWGQTADLRLLHVNDFHGFAEPHRTAASEELRGGAAFLAGAVARLRTGRPTLLLAAGDMIRGHSWANLFEGKSVIELMNAMGFDATVVGNHEFDYGPKVLAQRISEAKFPVLGANVEGLSQLKPYIIKELQGVKIGIIGIVTPETPTLTHPRNVAGLQFLTPEAALGKYLPEVRAKADLVVLLSHLGYPEDRKLAEKVKGIDVIIGGHTHTRIDKPEKVSQTIIVQAWEHGKTLGVLDLKVQNGKILDFSGYLEDLKPAPGQEDKKALEIVERFRGQADLLLNQEIAETVVDLDGQHVKSRETNLGNLVADVMREEAGADAALMNAGGIRGSIPQGRIRLKDVYTVLPYDNYLVALRLRGSRLKEALENGVAAGDKPSGRFPQVSGLTFAYDSQAPAGQRVRKVMVGGRPLDPGKIYMVATNDFLAAGGDGYKMLAAALPPSEAPQKEGELVYCDPSRCLRDLLVSYLQARKKVAPAVEGRIRTVN